MVDRAKYPLEGKGQWSAAGERFFLSERKVCHGATDGWYIGRDAWVEIREAGHSVQGLAEPGRFASREEAQAELERSFEPNATWFGERAVAFQAKGAALLLEIEREAPEAVKSWRELERDAPERAQELVDERFYGLESRDDLSVILSRRELVGRERPFGVEHIALAKALTAKGDDLAASASDLELQAEAGYEAPTITRSKYRRALDHERTWRRTALYWERHYHSACREAVRVTRAALARAEAAESELAALRQHGRADGAERVVKEAERVRGREAWGERER
jgi:hypothetical protein